MEMLSEAIEFRKVGIGLHEDGELPLDEFTAEAGRLVLNICLPR